MFYLKLKTLKLMKTELYFIYLRFKNERNNKSSAKQNKIPEYSILLLFLCY